MSVRKASTTLQRVSPRPPLVERGPRAEEPELGALDWQGTVRMAADRAAGMSAAAWQAHVRTGLLERALVLGADHTAGPHVERPETGRRLLAHIDALAEAGCSPADLVSFAREAELDRPGALWALSILFGCLTANGAEAFEDWVASLDMALFPTFQGIAEIAEALSVSPAPWIVGRSADWLGGSSPVLQAVALESMSPGEVSDERLLRLSLVDSPVVAAALERLIGRAAREAARPLPPRPSWLDIAVPGLAYEVAVARILMRDLEPLARLRRRDEDAISALGVFSLDVLALAGDWTDGDLASDLARRFATTPGLLSALGRIGLPSLFPRLLAELGARDFEDDAEEALVTALGPRPGSEDERGGPRGSERAVRGWEEVISRLPETAQPVRLRGGRPHGIHAVIAEMNRLDLSPAELRTRANEVFVMAERGMPTSWGAFGVSLEGAVSDVARLAR